MKAVVLAAGHGNRLLPFTSYRPKHLLPVAGKPILHHTMEYLRDIMKIDEVIIVVGHQKQIIMDYFRNGQDLNMKISYVIQHMDKQKGLAAALALVEEKITEDFVLILGDNLFSTDLSICVDIHNSSNAAATIHIEENEEPQRYGVVEVDGDTVVSLEEKPQNPKSNYVITGVYVFSPVIFNMIKGLKPSKRGEYELTDAIQGLIDKGYLVKASKIKGWRQDIGFPKDLLTVNKKYLTEKTHQVLGEVINSLIIPPVYIADNCVIKSSTIGPYVMIEKGVTIDNSEIENSLILENTEVVRVKISNSLIGTKCKVSGITSKSIMVGDYSVITNDY